MYVLFIALAITIGPGNALNTSQIQFESKALCDKAAKAISEGKGFPRYVTGAVQCFKVK